VVRPRGEEAARCRGGGVKRLWGVALSKCRTGGRAQCAEKWQGRASEEGSSEGEEGATSPGFRGVLE